MGAGQIGLPRVLVIDDEPMMLTTIARILRNVGEVTAVADGQEAVLLLEIDRAFDAVLCDVEMPRVGGREVYETVASRWPALLPRFTFVSGGSRSESTADFMRHTRCRVIRKPFDVADLRAVVERVVAIGDGPAHPHPAVRRAALAVARSRSLQERVTCLTASVEKISRTLSRLRGCRDEWRRRASAERVRAERAEAELVAVRKAAGE